MLFPGISSGPWAELPPLSSLSPFSGLVSSCFVYTVKFSFLGFSIAIVHIAGHITIYVQISVCSSRIPQLQGSFCVDFSAQGSHQSECLNSDPVLVGGEPRAHQSLSIGDSCGYWISFLHFHLVSHQGDKSQRTWAWQEVSHACHIHCSCS